MPLIFHKTLKNDGGHTKRIDAYSLRKRLRTLPLDGVRGLGCKTREPLGLGSVPSRIVTMFPAIAERPSHLRRVSFGAPTIQFRNIDDAIHKHLHAAGATGFPRSPGRIEPDIDTLHQVFGRKHCRNH